MSQSVPFLFYHHFESWFHLLSVIFFQLLFFVGYFGVLKNLADEEKKYQSLKSSASSIKCLEFAFGNLKNLLKDMLCCQVETVIIFITKIAKYFWHLNDLIHSLSRQLNSNWFEIDFICYQICISFCTTCPLMQYTGNNNNNFSLLVERKSTGTSNQLTYLNDDYYSLIICLHFVL